MELGVALGTRSDFPPEELRSGMPRPLHLALFVRRFRREVRAPFPPAPVVHGLMAPLRAIAQRRGHDGRYATARPALA